MQKYSFSCPKCKLIIQAGENRIMENIFCEHCGTGFIPGSTQDIELIKNDSIAPPSRLETISPTRKNTKRLTKKRKRRPIQNANPFFNVSYNIFLFVHLVALIYIFNNAINEQTIYFFLLIILPSFLLASFANLKGRMFWLWWLPCPIFFAYIMIVPILLFLVLLPLPFLRTCPECRKKIHAKSKICHYCKA